MNSRYDYVKCSIPNCDKGVGYHRTKNSRLFEGISIRWKTVCEKHRRPGIGKQFTDNWKMLQGCENRTGKYGVPCTSIITDPSQLEINHIDGNNTNRDPDNIEVLCSNCHRIATVEQNHHLPKIGKNNIGNRDLFPDL
jgi:hypothetical protein